MKKVKKWIALVILVVLAPLSAGAQVRIDPIVTVPVYLGIKLGDITGGAQVNNVFPLPELQGHYVFGGDSPIRVGVGARVFTFILESMITPNVFVEVEMSNLVLNASVAGLWYGFFGIAQGSGSGAVIMPEGSLEYKFADFFRLGVGALFFGDYKNIDQYNAYAVFVRARFPLLLK